MGITGTIGKKLAPRIHSVAPEATDKMVREALHRAVVGVGPLPGAAAMAAKELADEQGDVEKAIKGVILRHVRYAAAEGFVTNLGGLMALPVAIPANVAGLALIQCRMIAAIAHLRGHDLSDPRVRNAVLVCLLGEEDVSKLVKKKELPAPPMALATAPTYDDHLDRIVSAEVASELITRVVGTRLAITIGRRVPVVGGVVGGSADGWNTWQVGRYAARELLPRARR